MKRRVIEMLNLQKDSLAKINCGLTGIRKEARL